MPTEMAQSKLQICRRIRPTVKSKSERLKREEFKKWLRSIVILLINLVHQTNIVNMTQINFL